MIIYVLGKQSSGACLKIQVPQEDMGVIEHTPRRIFTMRAIGLLAPSQRYSTIEGEEACQLWPEKKWLLEKKLEGVVVVPKWLLWA